MRSAFGINIHEEPWMHPGTLLVFDDPRTAYVRNLSEITPLLLGARWHVERTTCPTWDESTECRCMTEEAA